MFYSNTLLARKGPLGTVWCAAHLQNRLKKSHYASTNIPTTVERIMYPEVPIALRMSGYLLIGVVRIYSKQVDYFLHDCNVILIRLKNSYGTSDVNLPENATHATLESVTLPDNFQLDALDLDNSVDWQRSPDNHLRSVDEITLEDQILAGQDPYIVVTFNEDALRNSSGLGDSSGSGPQPMEEVSGPSNPVGTGVGFQQPDPINQERNELLIEDTNPQNFPEIEIMRDATTLEYRLEEAPIWPDQGDDKMEPDTVLMEIMKEKENQTPENELVSGGPTFPSPQRQEPVSAPSEQGPEIFDSNTAFVAGHATPEIAVRSTPPPAEQLREKRRRKRQHYDELTVISNRVMKQRLEDSSDIRRKRKECPSSTLGIWKLNKRLKKDATFFEPLMTGLCSDLCDIYKKDFISSKPYLALAEESNLSAPESSEPVCDPVLDSSAPSHDNDIEIERLRNYEIPAGSNIPPEIIQSENRDLPSPAKSMPSPTRNDEFTPAFGTDISTRSDQVETTVGTTPDLAASTGFLGSDMETPMTFMEERLGVENTGLSDIPELVNSADGDLSFLAEDDHTLAGSQQGTPDYFLKKHSGASGVDTLSVRTRAVAQFLKSRSSVTPMSENQSGDLSLNKILEGKRKKLCARMVFETLVLKDCGLVDLQQEEPYGDITLKVTPKLSKEQFSS